VSCKVSSKAVGSNSEPCDLAKVPELYRGTQDLQHSGWAVRSFIKLDLTGPFFPRASRSTVRQAARPTQTGSFIQPLVQLDWTVRPASRARRGLTVRPAQTGLGLTGSRVLCGGSVLLGAFDSGIKHIYVS